MTKKLLIAGCSHPAGSEIDGNEDSKYNRQHSFGNLLAEKMGRSPVNIAQAGATNSGITRSVLEWFNATYTPSDDLTVLIGWTDPSRMEAPCNHRSGYDGLYHSIDWKSDSGCYYYRINAGYPGGDPTEREVVRQYHQFMAGSSTYLEIASANYVLQLQYFLRMHNVKYIMCNTQIMFTPSVQLSVYQSLIDQSCYYNMTDNTQCFYWKYANLGYKNTRAKYWHHGEEPHALYAEELYSFMKHCGID